MLRFATSSTDELTVADLRIALLNFVVAKQRNEGFILRFEDTDKARNIEGKEREIQEILEKFAVQADQVIHQSEQERRYQQLAVKLVETGKAFLCLCTPEDLEEERKRAAAERRPYRYSGRCISLDGEEIRRIKEDRIPFTIRIRKPLEPVVFDDLLRGEIAAEPNEVDHFVLLRSDGTPTRDFAGACDDMMEGIAMIIRDEERLSDTAKEIHVRRSLGYDTETRYLHLPDILDEEGRRITKHRTDYSVRHFLEEGFLPDALINHLLRLGNETPAEIFTLPEAVEWFDLKRLSPSPVSFDFERLRQLNQEHLRRMDDLALSRIFGFADAEIGRLAKLYLDEAATIRELDERIASIFSPKKCEGEGADAMRTLSALILEAPMFRDFDAFKAYLRERSTLGEERFTQALRLLMTGREEGPALSDIYKYIKSYITEVARCQP